MSQTSVNLSPQMLKDSMSKTLGVTFNDESINALFEDLCNQKYMVDSPTLKSNSSKKKKKTKAKLGNGWKVKPTGKFIGVRRPKGVGTDKVDPMACRMAEVSSLRDFCRGTIAFEDQSSVEGFTGPYLNRFIKLNCKGQGTPYATLAEAHQVAQELNALTGQRKTVQGIVLGKEGYHLRTGFTENKLNNPEKECGDAEVGHLRPDQWFSGWGLMTLWLVEDHSWKYDGDQNQEWLKQSKIDEDNITVDDIDREFKQHTKQEKKQEEENYRRAEAKYILEQMKETSE